MKTVEPGHTYVLDCLHTDPNQPSVFQTTLAFVKRLGDKYPGNQPPAREGPNMQEVLRALIDRTKYLDQQEPSNRNSDVIDHLRAALINLELRHAEKKGWSTWRLMLSNIELVPACRTCGHLFCKDHP